MDPLLSDLLSHQLWADAAQWSAIAAHPAAQNDTTIRDRLHHLHYVQRAFVWIVGNRTEPFVTSKPGDCGSFEALRDFARESHRQIVGCRDELSEEKLNQPIEVPWFKDPPLTLTRAEALTQMAMHSQWHRGQNATRLRELGGEPPTIDLIVWYWKGRPSAML